MDERLSELFDQLSPAELDTLIGDLPLDEEIEPDVLDRLDARVRAAVGGDRRRSCPRVRPGNRLHRAAVCCVALVLATALVLGNAVTVHATGRGLFMTVAQWAQNAVSAREPPITDLDEDGTAEFRGRRVDITPHTLLCREEAEGVAYRVELTSLVFDQTGSAGKWQNGRHAYLYLYVDGQTADFAELREGEEVVLQGGPGTCLLVVVPSVRVSISGTITRTAADPALGRDVP